MKKIKYKTNEQKLDKTIQDKFKQIKKIVKINQLNTKILNSYKFLRKEINYKGF